VEFPALGELRAHLAKDRRGKDLLKKLVAEVPIIENPNASPSLWYMPLVGGEHFFDGFGFADYAADFRWGKIPLDEQEVRHPPRNPLLRFLQNLNRELPPKWDRAKKCFAPNDDWIVWDLRKRDEGAQVAGARRPARAKRLAPQKKRQKRR
jgi:hypothetical protein